MSPIAQAGAIAVKLDGDRPLFLVVRSKQTPEAWVFPKGHVERGESDTEAALRELHEEAGVEGRIMAPVGAMEFTGRKGRMRVEFFLTEFLAQTGTGDGREQSWQPYERARELLSHEAARGLLDRSAEILARNAWR